MSRCCSRLRILVSSSARACLVGYDHEQWGLAGSIMLRSWAFSEAYGQPNAISYTEIPLCLLSNGEMTALSVFGFRAAPLLGCWPPDRARDVLNSSSSHAAETRIGSEHPQALLVFALHDCINTGFSHSRTNCQ